MLLTDVWEALEYTNREPPAHILLRPIAAFFGQKFAESEGTAEPEAKGKKKKNQQGAMLPVMHAAGKTQSGDAVPKHIRGSKKLADMFKQLKEDEKNE